MQHSPLTVISRTAAGWAGSYTSVATRLSLYAAEELDQ